MKWNELTDTVAVDSQSRATAFLGLPLTNIQLLFYLGLRNLQQMFCRPIFGARYSFHH